ncbi:MAG: hypothetical protein ABJA70_16940, partial [Chryseolinea sp.]
RKQKGAHVCFLFLRTNTKYNATDSIIAQYAPPTPTVRQRSIPMIRKTIARDNTNKFASFIGDKNSDYFGDVGIG